MRLRPSWDEGWWYLGALSYERGLGAQAARAFARFVALKPDSGAGWALRGLSEFQAKDYAGSMRHLARGLSLGSVGNAEIRDAVYYHMALLRIRASQFELAVEPLAALARAKTETPDLVAACGVFLLRMPLLPGDVPEERRELVQAAGRAAFAALGLKAEASQRFEEALARYPDAPNLHYGYGGYLLQQGEEHAAAALDQFRKEIEVNPSSVYAPPRDRVRAPQARRARGGAAVRGERRADRPGPLRRAPRPRARAGRDRGGASRRRASWRRRCASRPRAPRCGRRSPGPT